MAWLALARRRRRPGTTSTSCRRRRSRRRSRRSPPASCRSRPPAAPTSSSPARGGRRCVRKGIGPTTGVVVGADGYVISSAFNFVNKPTTILVARPRPQGALRRQGRRHRPDAHADAAQESTPRAAAGARGRAPKDEIHDRPDGHRPRPHARPPSVDAAAVGQRRHHQRPRPHLGQGDPDRRQGVADQLRRAAGRHPGPRPGHPGAGRRRRPRARRPASSGTTPASASPSRWRTSTPCCRACSRARQGAVVLKRGLLGVTMQSRRHVRRASRSSAPSRPDSAADKAGLKPGDVIMEIDGKPVAQLRPDAARPRRASTRATRSRQGHARQGGDDVRRRSCSAAPSGVRARRSSASCRCATTRSRASRSATSTPRARPTTAGLKAGDRIMKIVGRPAEHGARCGRSRPRSAGRRCSSRGHARHRGQGRGQPQGRQEDRDADGEARRDARDEDEVPDKLPEKASAKKALEPQKPAGRARRPSRTRAEEGRQEGREEGRDGPDAGARTPAARPRPTGSTCRDNYDPNIAYALVIWLHPVGKNKEKDVEDCWTSGRTTADDNNIILVCPKAENKHRLGRRARRT